MKRKVGRPTKMRNINLDQVRRLASLGLIDEELAFSLGIAKSTLNMYKKNQEFMDSLKAGKLIADDKVVQSLFLRAMGYEHHEEKIFCERGRVIRADTIKHYAPETAACIFWLKNRLPDVWKDKHEIKGEGFDSRNLIQIFQGLSAEVLKELAGSNGSNTQDSPNRISEERPILANS